MKNLIKKIRKKVNRIIYSLSFSGLVMLMLGVLIIWTDFVLRIIVGVFVMVLAYTFFYAAHKLHTLKKDIESHFNLK